MEKHVDFEAFAVPVAAGFLDEILDLPVHPFGDGVVEAMLEVRDDPRRVFPGQAGHALQRRHAALRGHGAPALQVSGGVARIEAAPELPEDFLDGPGLGGPQGTGPQIGKPLRPAFWQVFEAPEPQLAGALQAFVPPAERAAYSERRTSSSARLT